MSTNTEQKTTQPRVLKGVVVSNKMKDTVVVAVERFVMHPQYKKFIKLRKRYHADDKGNTKEVGDKVEIMETKPISKLKRFKIV